MASLDDFSEAYETYRPLIEDGFDLIDNQLARKAELRKFNRNADNERYRDITDRQGRERDDENDLYELRRRFDNDRFRDEHEFENERAKDEAFFENERFRDQTDRDDGIRDDQRSFKDMLLGHKNDGYESKTDRILGQREAKRRQYAEQTERNSQLQADRRDMLETRAGVRKDAFESRRGDTLISRIMVPLAFAAGIAGAVYLVRKGAT